MMMVRNRTWCDRCTPPKGKSCRNKIYSPTYNKIVLPTLRSPYITSLRPSGSVNPKKVMMVRKRTWCDRCTPPRGKSCRNKIYSPTYNKIVLPTLRSPYITSLRPSGSANPKKVMMVRKRIWCDRCTPPRGKSCRNKIYSPTYNKIVLPTLRSPYITSLRPSGSVNPKKVMMARKRTWCDRCTPPRGKRCRNKIYSPTYNKIVLITLRSPYITSLRPSGSVNPKKVMMVRKRIWCDRCTPPRGKSCRNKIYSPTYNKIVLPTLRSPYITSLRPSGSVNPKKVMMARKRTWCDRCTPPRGKRCRNKIYSPTYNKIVLITLRSPYITSLRPSGSVNPKKVMMVRKRTWCDRCTPPRGKSCRNKIYSPTYNKIVLPTLRSPYITSLRPSGSVNPKKVIMLRKRIWCDRCTPPRGKRFPNKIYSHNYNKIVLPTLRSPYITSLRPSGSVNSKKVMMVRKRTWCDRCTPQRGKSCRIKIYSPTYNKIVLPTLRSHTLQA